jgi:hypothetical protein
MAAAVAVCARADVEAPIAGEGHFPLAVDAVVVEPAEVRTQQAFETALALLRGTEANHVLCCAAMATSVILAVVGFVMMVDTDTCGRDFAITTMLFMISQSFTVAKTSRDQKMAATALVAPELENASEYQFMMPTHAYIAQVFGFFLVSLILAMYSLVSLRVKQEWYGFAGLSFLWVLVTSLCLAKSVRDRQDAGTWAASPPDVRGKQLQHILGVCSGTLEYKALVWASFPIAAAVTLAWTWLGFAEAELPVERKGFLTLAVVFNAISCFHLAKLVRDKANKAKAKELAQQLPFQVMVVASWLVSTVVPGISLFLMPLKSEQRCFLGVGFLMTMNSALNLAKLVRDNLEVKNIKQGCTE